MKEALLKRIVLLFALTMLMVSTVYALRVISYGKEGLQIDPTKAPIILMSDEGYVGTADLVIIGTVQYDERMDPPREWITMKATVRVDQVLKGAPAKTVSIYHVGLPAGLMIDNGGFALEHQVQSLFFLQRLQDGYALINGIQGKRPVEQADHFRQLIADFPIQVTLELPPATPCYFEQNLPVTISVSNRGNTAVEVRNPYIESYFASPRTGLNARLLLQYTPTHVSAGLIPLAPPLTVEPGKTEKYTLFATSQRPTSWQLFTPDTYLLTPVMLRACVFVPFTDAGGDGLHPTGYFVASPWQQVLVGFPPPPAE